MLYQGLVLSTMKDEDAAQAILDVFSSFITDEISDFNSNVYYTNPDYLRCSYLEGKMLSKLNHSRMPIAEKQSAFFIFIGF